jgi:threonine aldolase
MIDYRSDTFTKPSQPMLDAMFKADVGDDVFGEDPSINRLETMAAEIFGMEKALFCPSGTMSFVINLAMCIFTKGVALLLTQDAR